MDIIPLKSSIFGIICHRFSYANALLLFNKWAVDNIHHHPLVDSGFEFESDNGQYMAD